MNTQLVFDFVAFSETRQYNSKSVTDMGYEEHVVLADKLL